MDKVEVNNKALRIASRSLTIHVRSVDRAAQVMADPKAGKFARRLDDRTLIISESWETVFRKALRQMGYELIQ